MAPREAESADRIGAMVGSRIMVHDVKIRRSADRRTITVKIHGEPAVIFGLLAEPIIHMPDGGLGCNPDLVRRACLALRLARVA